MCISVYLHTLPSIFVFFFICLCDASLMSSSFINMPSVIFGNFDLTFVFSQIHMCVILFVWAGMQMGYVNNMTLNTF